MSKLSDFHKLKEKFSKHANKENMERINDIELSLIQEELFPKLQEKIMTLFKDIDIPLKLSVNYTPGEEVSVSLREGERKSDEKSFVPEIVCEHELYATAFNNMIHVEKQYHNNIYHAIGGDMEDGDSLEVSIIFEGQEYNIRLAKTFIKRDNVSQLRFMYTSAKHKLFATALQVKFTDAYEYILSNKNSKLPEHLKRTLIFKSTPKPMTFTLECK